MKKRCSGILLAGGASSRMGTDKTALQWNDMSLVEWQAKKLHAAGADEILLCGKTSCDLPGVRCLPDLLPHRGPLGGLYSGLIAAAHPCAMVISVDIPLLPVDTLQMLLSHHKTDITLLYHGERLEPLIGIYEQRLAPVILSLIQPGSAPVRALLERCTWEAVAYQGDEALLCNCNTPDDYQKAIQLASMHKR